MLTDQQISSAADLLDHAERSLEQIGLLSQAYPAMDMADAYRIQDCWVKRKQAAGDTQVGMKIGLTSRAMQQALNITMPDSGVLLESMQFLDGAVITNGRFIAPRVEAELAFIMKSDLKPKASIYDVLNATDFVVPALEILDTRIQRIDPVSGRTRNVCDTIADNAANAGFVLGANPIKPDTHDLRWLGALVSANGQVQETGLAAGVLNHPAQGIAWLAERLGTLGEHIRAGQIVLSGSFIRPIEAPPGTTITADFGPLGTIACHFAQE